MKKKFMNNIVSRVSSVFSGLFVFVTGCSGPAGPQGPAGIQGSASTENACSLQTGYLSVQCDRTIMDSSNASIVADCQQSVAITGLPAGAKLLTPVLSLASNNFSASSVASTIGVTSASNYCLIASSSLVAKGKAQIRFGDPFASKTLVVETRCTLPWVACI